MSILKKDRLTIKALADEEARFATEFTDSTGHLWDEMVPTYKNAVGLSKGTDNFFYKKEHEKKRIVLHATHGYLTGDIANLSKQHVSTAYLIARSGVVYEMFDPKWWSYHLGGLGKNYWTTNTVESQQTIGIEISNMGPLTPHASKPDILLDAWGFPYCMTSDTDYYIKKDYRGYSHFATFTIEQHRALDSLLLHLCRRFNLLHSFLPVAERLDLLDKEPKAGIVSHVNYRQNKWDAGPSLHWDKISGR